ncbi:hypothetical protein BU204_05200 [Actinophytocola xanthii]|uniref:DUF3558 domain-containing protein n=1 Tax=Actinophytocola xanthii TaxID=1912961 RepID=A0A1Q8CWB7_9PSEU|nr:hypothetical protein BU204_05200 [Actinophytocola xanthii]
MLLALAAVLLVAGCGEPVDTAKVTYPRTTVPAGALPSNDSTSTGGQTPRTNDPAFAPEKLRVLDPCPLLDEELLDQLGSPAENNRGGYSECANYMEDDEGKDLNITLTLGDKVVDADAAEDVIGGLPAMEKMLDGNDACFVTVVTSTSPNYGIVIQTNGGADDLCGAGRKVMTDVVERIRSDSPEYDLARGTLIDLDPCSLFEGDALNENLGGETENSPYNLHWCNWTGPTATLGVWLRLGFNPELGGNGDQVDLGGGIKGFQEKTVSTAGSCQLEWKHRPFAGDDVEIVTLTLDIRELKAGADPCAPAQAIAKTLIPALPKA